MAGNAPEEITGAPWRGTCGVVGLASIGFGLWSGSREAIDVVLSMSVVGVLRSVLPPDDLSTSGRGIGVVFVDTDAFCASLRNVLGSSSMMESSSGSSSNIDSSSGGSLRSSCLDDPARACFLLFSIEGTFSSR